MERCKYKLAIVEDNPVHFRVPIYKEMAKNKKIDFDVYFGTINDLSDRYRFETRGDKGFNIKLDGFEYSVLKNYYSFKERLPPKGLWNFGIVSELIENKYDAVIIYGYSSLLKKLAYVGAILSGTPIIFREEIDEVAQHGIKRFLKMIFYKFLFKVPRAFLYSYTKNRNFYESFGVSNDKLFLHPVAVDNKLYQSFAKKMRKKDIRKSMGIPGASNVFLCVGTIDKRKDSFNVLRAFKSLNDENNYLICLGDGPQKKELQYYVKNNGMKNVKFFDFKSDVDAVARIYSVADVFVIASVSDPSPKVLNEAMNFSLAIVASDGVGTAMIWLKMVKMVLFMRVVILIS